MPAAAVIERIAEEDNITRLNGICPEKIHFLPMVLANKSFGSQTGYREQNQCCQEHGNQEGLQHSYPLSSSLYPGILQIILLPDIERISRERFCLSEAAKHSAPV
jgi:hypothetical protein